MPGGSTVGSKLMSRAFPWCSVSTDVRVNVPASTVRRSAGQGRVASFSGSEDSATVSISFHCTGAERIWWTSASKSALGPDAGALCRGATGTKDQRTGVRAPESLVMKNVLRLWKVLSAKPDDGGLWLMIFMALAVSGCALRNAAMAFGSGLP